MKKVLLALLLSCASYSFGQDLGYGKVSILDFEIEAEDKTEVHDAIYILNSENSGRRVGLLSPNSTRFFKLIHKRIRIQNEEGLAYATNQIALFQSEGGNEKINTIKGSTYNLENGKIKQSELDVNNLFEESLNEFYKTTSFTMPNVRIGSIVEFHYVIDTPFPYIDDIYLQYEIPVINLDVNIQFYGRFTYDVVFNPFSNYKVQFDKTQGQNEVTTLILDSDGDDFFENDLKVDMLRMSDNDILSLNTKNVPALKKEPFSAHIDRFRAKIVISLSSVRKGIISRAKAKDISTTWEAVAKTIYDSDNFGDEIKQSRFYRKDLEEIIEPSVTDKQKIVEVLKFLKSKVKWNNKYGVYTKDGLKHAYKTGSGNVSEVNLLLVSMLREAGIEAYPVLVSSSDSETPIFPTREGFDYIVVQATYGDEKVLLDATEKYAGLNLIPLRAANWKGRLIKKDGASEWIKLTENQKSEEITLLEIALDNDSHAIGNGQKRYSNYMALRARNSNANSTEDELEKYVQNDNVGLEVSEVKLEGLEDVDSNLTLKYDVKYKNAVDNVGDKIYVTPLLYEANEENPFKLETRKLPVDLSFPVKTKTIVNIKMPEGYEVESMPENVKIMYNDNVGYYKYMASYANGVISTVATFDLSISVIQPDGYVAFKKFFEAIVEKDAQKIVLKKI